MVDSCPLTLICFKSVLSDASKMLSALYPLTPSCGGRSHWICIVKVLFGVWKQNSSPEPTEHSLHILCLFWSLGWTWQYRKPSQRLEFPKKLPCAGEMFSRSWSFLIIEQGDEMAAGSIGNFLWGRVHIQDISVPGKFCQGWQHKFCIMLKVYCLCLLSC